MGEATGGWYPVKVGDKSGWVSGDYVIAETSYSYGETKEEEEKRIAEEEAQEKWQHLSFAVLTADREHGL